MGTEADPPPAGSGEKIRREYFAWARRGFDPTEVREFLATVASAIEALETELHRAQPTAEAATQGENARQSNSTPARTDAAGLLEERVARLIAVGEREVETMLEEAKAEAATIVSEATSEAGRIRSAAKSEARRAVKESRAFLVQAKEESGRTLSDVAERRRVMMGKLEQTQERLLRIAQDLELEHDRVGPDADVPEAEN